MRRWQIIARVPRKPLVFSGLRHGLHVFVPEKFLHGTNVRSALQQMGCERMRKGVAGGVFRYPCLTHRFGNHLLEQSSNPGSPVGDVPGHFWMLACVPSEPLRNEFSPWLSAPAFFDKER